MSIIVINSIFFSILLLMATIILINLTRSEDGIMRKRLIEYFSSEDWLLAVLLIYECVNGQNIRIETQYVLLIAFAPKVIAKIRLFLYLNNNSK